MAPICVSIPPCMLIESHAILIHSCGNLDRNMIFYLWKDRYVWLDHRIFSSTTGSTIRNWQKVKTWLDQMFWQIYQKANEAGEVFKAWKITTVDFRVFQVLEFNDFRTNITLFWCFKNNNFSTESWKLMLNFSNFSVGGRWGQVRSKKFQIVDQA